MPGVERYIDTELSSENMFRCLSCDGMLALAEQDRFGCLGCGTVYPCVGGIPILVRNWKLHAAELESWQRENPNWYVSEQPEESQSPWRHHLRKRRIYVKTAIEQFLREQGLERVERLLDIGCGDGNHLSYLAAYADKVYGSDYNIVRLARAKPNNHMRGSAAGYVLFLADILDYPVCDNFFDIVFFNHALEHISQDVKALQTVYRILKPGGLLVLGTPNEGVWWWQLAYRLQPASLKNSDHVQFYTAEILSKRVRESGFQVREVKHMGWGPPLWWLDARVRRYEVLDDLFEVLGKALIPTQASSLYLLAYK